MSGTDEMMAELRQQITDLTIRLARADRASQTISDWVEGCPVI